MIAHFSLRLICGMSLMWSIMPRSQVSSGFFRIQMLVALGLSVLAALSTGHFTAAAAIVSETVGMTVCSLIAVCAFLGSVMWALERRKAGELFVIVIAVASTAVLLLSTLTSQSFASVSGYLHLASELSTASLLGGAVTGMLLGHWYLTAPTMSIAPLNRLTLFFGTAALTRCVLSAVGLYLAWGQIATTTHWNWLGLRWLTGIIGPLVVFVMVWRILKYRNTQAATGVLFVGVILTFIGEMTASLLYQELQQPL